MTKFGDRIRVERLARGLLQREVAVIAEVSQTALSAWERGSSLPMLPGPPARERGRQCNFVALGGALGIPVSELTGLVRDREGRDESRRFLLGALRPCRRGHEPELKRLIRRADGRFVYECRGCAHVRALEKTPDQRRRDSEKMTQRQRERREDPGYREAWNRRQFEYNRNRRSDPILRAREYARARERYAERRRKLDE